MTPSGPTLSNRSPLYLGLICERSLAVFEANGSFAYHRRLQSGPVQRSSPAIDLQMSDRMAQETRLRGSDTFTIAKAISSALARVTASKPTVCSSFCLARLLKALMKLV